MRRFAAIMFTDMVGYTALMGSDERKAFNLLRQNRQIHKRIISKYGGKWLKEMGDGILASFQTATNAVLCAAEIQLKAKDQQIRLRIGLHAGEVVFEGRDVLGDGVNVASRLETLAEEGQICISGTVYNNIKNKQGFQTTYLGEKHLKNVAEPVKVYQLQVNAEDYAQGVIDLPGKIVWSSRMKIVVGIGLAVMVIAMIGILLAGKAKRGESAEMEKSIAVLQFRNLSGEEENQYFTAGVMEAINNHLSGIKELRVSTRTATGKYKNSDMPVREIGKELEVAYVLEGSVQKYLDRLRISVRIIDVLNDRQVWSKQYTETLSDIFDLMTKIALDVTSELRISLTPREQSLLANHSTTDINAYDLYMRGRNYYSNYISLLNRDDLIRAENLYKEAIDIDSTFALAYVGLGEVCDQRHHLYGWISKYKEAYEDSILMYASKALTFDTNLADAYALRGQSYGYKKQVDRAIEDQEKAISLNPNLAESYFNLGKIWLDDKNDPVMAYRYMKTAQFYERNGTRLPEIIWYLGTIHLLVDDFPVAERYYRQMIQLLPGNPKVYGTISWVYWSQGKFEEALAYEDSCGISREEGFAGHLFYYMGEFEEALKYWEHPQGDGTEGIVETDSGINFNLAYMYMKSGRYREGRAMIEEDLSRLLSAQEQQHGQISLDYAALGENEKAIEELLKEEAKNPYSFTFTFMPHYHVYNNLLADPAVVKLLERIKVIKDGARKEIQELDKSGTGLLVAG